MIVPAMNSEEIIREIFLDFDKVERKALYIYQNLRRKTVKSKNLTFIDVTDYKSLRKNEWIISIICNRKCHCTIYCVHYLNHLGFNAINVFNREKVIHYSSHFLERYNERFLKQNNVSKIDLLKNFIAHNTMIVTDVIDPEDFKMRRMVAKFKQGISLGTIEYQGNIKITDYKTFISNEMIYESQKEEVKTLDQYYHTLLEKDQLFKRIVAF